MHTILNRSTLYSTILVSALLLAVGCDSNSAGSGTNSVSASGQADAGTASKPIAPKRVKMNVAEIDAAKLRVRDVAMQIGSMADDLGFERSITGVDNAHGKIDISAAMKDLELLAQLPDHTDNEFITPVSKTIPLLKEAFEMYQKSLESKKPFSDGSGAGEKMAKQAGDNYLNLVVGVDESKKLVDPVQ